MDTIGLLLIGMLIGAWLHSWLSPKPIDKNLELPIIESWNDMQIVDTDGNLDEGGEDNGHYGECIRKHYLMSVYSNGVIIKPKKNGNT